MTHERAKRVRRARTTRLSVRIQERAVRLLITIGGIGTIAAVAMILVFLIGVVVPLFSGAEVSQPRVASVPPDVAMPPVRFAIDDYGLLASSLERDGRIRVFELESGELVQELAPFAALDLPSAWSAPATGRSLACGFADGSVRLVRFGFSIRFPAPDSLAVELREIPPGTRRSHDGGMLERMPDGRFRLLSFDFELGEPMALTGGAQIERLAHAEEGERVLFMAWVQGGRLVRVEAERGTNFLTGEEEFALQEESLPYVDESARGTPAQVLLMGNGDTVLLVWEDGHLERLDVRDPEQTAVAEIVDLAPGDARVSALTSLIGASTLVVGTSDGSLAAWFGTKPSDGDTLDGTVFVRAHELLAGGPAVVALSPSPRSRMLAAALSDNSVLLFQVTSERSLARVEAAQELGAIRALSLMSKEDGIVALGERGAARWSLEPGHPEAGVRAFFAPVWYEGYAAPSHTWQSASGTDDFEPKLGFTPLVYGTLKATFYSMLFGAPLALLAALFTSEYLDRRLRVPVKSTIEMMASLPSVVLGFLAAIVVAPFAQTIIPATLAIFVTLPFALLLGAYLWQCLPARLAIRAAGWPKLMCIALALPLAVMAALLLGPVLERALFAGDLELWLDGQIGRGFGGWMLVGFPLAALLVALTMGRLIGSWMQRRGVRWSRERSAMVDLVKFAVLAAATVLLALLVSWSLDVAGLDPRGTFVDTYVQRNALVVGFVMGFAVIPIIYTLAEDALSGVPQSLRLASLAAGATTWQTAVRLVVPTSMSGLFSAVMIGLGRAVGETMIVLMATGNTPVMDLNVFNGFRTLSANIAVELPEAVQGSTHYRALFLAALVLFGMTLFLNTLAESLRQRFRRRAVQL